MNQITFCKECGEDIVLEHGQYKGNGQHTCKKCDNKNFRWDE